MTAEARVAERIHEMIRTGQDTSPEVVVRGRFYQTEIDGKGFSGEMDDELFAEWEARS